LPRSTLYDYVRSKLGCKPIILPALEEKIVKYLLVIERKYCGCTRDDVIRLAVQFPVHNKTASPYSISKEGADKDWFKRCMKRHSDKLSLCQPTGTSTARATGFSKEQAGIFFDLYEKSLLLMITTFTYFQGRRNWFNSGSKERTKNPRTQRPTSDWPFNYDIKGFFSNNCMHQCQWSLVSSPNFTVETLPCCYLPSLFLNISQSCLVTSDSIRHYQPLFRQAYFALPLLKLLYLRLYLSNHRGLSQATKQRTGDYIWVEKYFKKSF